MPELPEVEAARRAAATVAVGRRITRVWAADDRLVLEGVSPARLRRALLGRQVRAARRHGKHLWLELDRRPWPCVPFGMTGGLHTSRTPAVRPVSGGRPAVRADWPPRFTRLRLAFDDGHELAIADGRRLGAGTPRASRRSPASDSTPFAGSPRPRVFARSRGPAGRRSRRSS